MKDSISAVLTTHTAKAFYIYWYLWVLIAEQTQTKGHTKDTYIQLANVCFCASDRRRIKVEALKTREKTDGLRWKPVKAE